MARPYDAYGDDIDPRDVLTDEELEAYYRPESWN